MKYNTESEAMQAARFANELVRTQWFCPFRNDKCYGIGCIAFNPVQVDGRKTDADTPGCNMTSWEINTDDNSSNGFAMAAMVGSMAAIATIK